MAAPPAAAPKLRDPLTALAICAAYGTVSGTLALVNKSMLGSLPAAVFSLVSVQLLLSLLVCSVGARWPGNPLALPPGGLTPALLHSASPVAVLYVANVATGLIGLSLTSVPLFFALRRLVPACILVVEWCVAGKVPSREVSASVAMLALGALMASWNTLSADAVGVGITFVNNLLTAALFVMQRRLSQSSGLTTFGLVQAVAVVALPLALALAWGTGEWLALAAMEARLWSARISGALLLSSALGIALSATSVLCTTYNSPLTTSITGNVKDLFVTAIGWWLFGGFKATALSLCGIALSFVGAGLYSSLALGDKAPPLAAAPSRGGAPQEEEEEGDKGHKQARAGVPWAGMTPRV